MPPGARTPTASSAHSPSPASRQQTPSHTAPSAGSSRGQSANVAATGGSNAQGLHAYWVATPTMNPPARESDVGGSSAAGKNGANAAQSSAPSIHLPSHMPTPGTPVAARANGGGAVSAEKHPATATSTSAYSAAITTNTNGNNNTAAPASGVSASAPASAAGTPTLPPAKPKMKRTGHSARPSWLPADMSYQRKPSSASSSSPTSRTAPQKPAAPSPLRPGIAAGTLANNGGAAPSTSVGARPPHVNGVGSAGTQQQQRQQQQPDVIKQGPGLSRIETPVPVPVHPTLAGFAAKSANGTAKPRHADSARTNLTIVSLGKDVKVESDELWGAYAKGRKPQDASPRPNGPMASSRDSPIYIDEDETDDGLYVADADAVSDGSDSELDVEIDHAVSDMAGPTANAHHGAAVHLVKAPNGWLYSVWHDKAGKAYTNTFGLLFPDGYRLYTEMEPGAEAAKTPWICPLRLCHRLFANLKSCGLHFSTMHRQMLLNDNRDGTFSLVRKYDTRIDMSRNSRPPLVISQERIGPNAPAAASPLAKQITTTHLEDDAVLRGVRTGMQRLSDVGKKRKLNESEAKEKARLRSQERRSRELEAMVEAPYNTAVPGAKPRFKQPTVPGENTTAGPLSSFDGPDLPRPALVRVPGLNDRYWNVREAAEVVGNQATEWGDDVKRAMATLEREPNWVALRPYIRTKTEQLILAHPMVPILLGMPQRRALAFIPGQEDIFIDTLTINVVSLLVYMVGNDVNGSGPDTGPACDRCVAGFGRVQGCVTLCHVQRSVDGLLTKATGCANCFYSGAQSRCSLYKRRGDFAALEDAADAGPSRPSGPAADERPIVTVSADVPFKDFMRAWEKEQDTLGGLYGREAQKEARRDVERRQLPAWDSNIESGESEGEADDEIDVAAEEEEEGNYNMEEGGIYVVDVAGEDGREAPTGQGRKRSREDMEDSDPDKTDTDFDGTGGPTTEVRNNPGQGAVGENGEVRWGAPRAARAAAQKKGYALKRPRKKRSDAVDTAARSKSVGDSPATHKAGGAFEPAAAAVAVAAVTATASATWAASPPAKRGGPGQLLTPKQLGKELNRMRRAGKAEATAAASKPLARAAHEKWRKAREALRNDQVEIAASMGAERPGYADARVAAATSARAPAATAALPPAAKKRRSAAEVTAKVMATRMQPGVASFFPGASASSSASSLSLPVLEGLSIPAQKRPQKRPQRRAPQRPAQEPREHLQPHHHDPPLLPAALDPEPVLEAADWELAPGRVRGAARRGGYGSASSPSSAAARQAAVYGGENVAFSAPFLTLARGPMPVWDGVGVHAVVVRMGMTYTFPVLDGDGIGPPHAAPGEDDNEADIAAARLGPTLRLVVVTRGRLRVRLEAAGAGRGDPASEFDIGQGGVFRVEPGARCRVECRVLVDAMVNVNTFRVG